MPIQKSKFIPKNPQKYIAANINDIIARSSWELTFMMNLDQNESILAWMSESLPTRTIHKGISGIPYRNPLTGKWTIYVPDFFVVYVDKNKKQHAEVVEIKPFDETLAYNSTAQSMSARTGKYKRLKEARQIVNAAKFKAAIQFCASRGWRFRVVTERELFKRPTL